eukprot:5900774-Prymnesium_polylepis.1
MATGAGCSPRGDRLQVRKKGHGGGRGPLCQQGAVRIAPEGVVPPSIVHRPPSCAQRPTYWKSLCGASSL